jgi:carotenoid cleavage dioxygenase-like enzyme
MSFSFEGLPRTLDTAMFKREKFDDGPPAILGWVVVLTRAAAPSERRWFEKNGFANHHVVNEWRRSDLPDDFEQQHKGDIHR